MDPNVLQEFLVKLGFDVDQAKLKKFTDSTTEVVKRVALIGAAIETAATAVAAGVTKISGNFEDLYYASQRLQASVANIEAYSFGLSQVGVAAGAAQSAVGSLASFIRSNPGAARFIQGAFGVGITDASGKPRDMTQVIGDLTAWAAKNKNSPWLVQQRLSDIGITDPSVQFAMMDNSAQAAQFEARKRQVDKDIGLDPNAAAKTATDFQHQVDDLKMVAGELTKKVGLDLMAQLLPYLERFDKWLTSPKAIQWITDAAKWVINLGLEIANFAVDVVQWFARLNDATDGWAGKLLLLGLAIKASGIVGFAASLGSLLLALDPIVLAILAAAGAFALLALDYSRWKAGMSSVVNWAPFTNGIEEVISDLRQLGLMLGAVAQVAFPYLGPVVENFVQNALGTLHTALQIIITDLKVMWDLLHGDPVAAAKDVWKGAVSVWNNAASQDRGAAARQPSPANGNAPGGLLALFSGAGSTDPQNQPRTLVRTMVDLNATMRGLGDSISNWSLNPDGSGSGGSRGAGTGTAISDDRPLGPAVKVAAGKIIGALMAGAGFSTTQATGAMAVMGAESGLNANAWNKVSAGVFHGVNDHAQGLAQWIGSRKVAFQQFAGHDLSASTPEEQIRFIVHELENTKAGKLTMEAMKSARTTQDAMSVWAKYFEGANGKGYAYDMAAGRRYLDAARLGGGDTVTRNLTVTQTATIHVHDAIDPVKTGHAVYSEQARLHSDTLRHANRLGH
jgi:Phage tail lysozyme